MKTNHISKIGCWTVALTLLSIGMQAQTPTSDPTYKSTAISGNYTEFTTTGRESVDSVTVNSRIPYKVEPQASITGLDFEYKWFLSPTATIKKLEGTNLTVTDDDYYNENEISVVMPDIASDITINTNVRSKANGIVLCTGDADDVYNVTVVNRPTIKWTGNVVPISFCSDDVDDATIPVTVTGYSKLEITYTLKYYTTFDKSENPTETTKYLVLANKSSIELPASEFNLGIGIYEIEVTNITDRISRKSLDQELVKSKDTDLPTGTYTVMVYPKPKTKPLQHVKNVQ